MSVASIPVPSCGLIGRRGLGSPLSLVILTVAILFARRPDQFLWPQMWVEDGFHTLRNFLEGGARILVQPLNGYLITATKLISYVAFVTSVRFAPEIETALVVAFTCTVTVAIAFAPTHLRWPFLCALAALLAPTGAEVFAVSAYAFWWAGFLLLLALLWDTERGRRGLRVAFIIIGGLSSPLIISLAPLFAARAALTRRRDDVIAVGLVALTAAVQAYAMSTQRAGEVVGGTLDPWAAWAGVTKFIGGFVRFDALGPFMLVALALVVWSLRARLDRYFYLLAGAYALICASVVLRIPLDWFMRMGATGEGVRYFYYPFVLLMWLLLWLASEAGALMRTAIIAVLALGILLGVPYMQWRHDAVDWRAQLDACAHGERSDLTIQYLGTPADAWHAKFTAEQCRALMAKGPF